MPRSWRGGATAHPLVLEALPPLHLSGGPRCTASKSLQIHSQPRALPSFSLGPQGLHCFGISTMCAGF